MWALADDAVVGIGRHVDVFLEVFECPRGDRCCRRAAVGSRYAAMVIARLQQNLRVR